MGNKYIEKLCSRCNQITTHRVFRRFGAVSKDGRKGMRREVSWCLECQNRNVDNKRKRH